MASLSQCCRGTHVRSAARPGFAIRTPFKVCFALSARQSQCSQEPAQQQPAHVDQQSQTLLQQSPSPAVANDGQQPWLPLLPELSGQAGAQVTLAVAVALLAISLSSEPASAADGVPHHSIQPVMDLAEGGEEFWGNVAKYGRYFVTVMLGTGYVMVQPLVAAFKKPVTAIAAIAGITGSVVLLRFVLNAMLGVQEPFDYVPGSIVPYS